MNKNNDSQNKILKKEWNAVKKEYPNFAFMFIENNALLGSLIKKTKGEHLKELIGRYTERSCLLGLLPKCPETDKPEIDPCEVIRLKCEKIRNESPLNPDGLDASDVLTYGECMREYHECKGDIHLCCE
jgi:hypothetical protein